MLLWIFVHQTNLNAVLSLWFRGPQDTCFEGGVFPAVLSFPSDYPLSPPKMRFTCEMFHPNSKSTGPVLSWTFVSGLLSSLFL